jgi:drug/metabolite transporter (DMT)-like permease
MGATEPNKTIGNQNDSSISTNTAQAITILAATFWGTSFVVIELGLEIINPFWFAQLRFLVASLGALAVVVLLKKRIEQKLLISHWVWLLGLFNALGFLGQFFGQTLTNATKTALLINLNVVTVALLSTLLLSEKFSVKKGLAIVSAIIGVLLLTTNGDLSQLARGEFIGDMFALAGGFAWAFYIVTNKKVISTHKIDVVTLTACVMLTTTIIMFPFTIILGGISPGVLNIGLSGLGFVIYLGIFCNVIPYTLWTFGLKHLPTTSSSILLLTEVVVAAILAMIILGEFLTLIGLLGGVAIGAAIILISLDYKGENKKKVIILP